MQPSVSQTLLRNTLFNVLGKSWGIILSLVMVPFLLPYLGIERFGLWALLGIITGYFNLLDLGFGASFVKYVSEYKTKSDFSSLNQVVRIGLLYYFLVSLLTIVLIYPWIPHLERFFHINSSFHDETRFVFLACLIVLMIQNTLSVYTSVINGLQKMGLANKINIVLSTVRTFGIVVCIVQDYGLKGLMVNQIIISALNGFTMMRASYFNLPQLKLRPWRLERRIFSQMFRFGLKMQISHIAHVVSFQMDRILIGYFFNIASVAFYDIALRISTSMRALLLLLTSAIVPMASELDSKEKKDTLKSLYFLGTKYLVFLSMPVFFFVVVSASDIIFVWVGSGFEKAVFVLQALLIGYYLNLVIATARTIAVGMGKPNLEMKYGIIMAALNLCLSIFLILQMGFYGAALGSAISLGLSSLYYMYLFHRLIGNPMSQYYQFFKWPAASCFGAWVILQVALQVASSFIVAASRIEIGLLVGMQFLLFAIVYIGLMLWSPYFERKEILLLLQKMPFLGGVYGKWTDGKQHRLV